jgi:hypothetical protein
MRVEKLSISLTPESVALIETYRRAHAMKSRSQVIEHALQRLRQEDLETAYREAAAERDLNREPDWDLASSDGLAHETW